MAIPYFAECLWLMDHYRMPEHIRAHSLMVGRVAETLARGLREQGHPINVELTLAGGLLHDIAKALCLGNDDNHAEQGQRICQRHGYEEVGPLVAGHVILPHRFNGRCGEQEIVYYADKRVRHDNVVSLEERRDDIIRRYAANDPHIQNRIRENFQQCRQVERQIFACLAIRPEELAAKLAGAERERQ